MIAQTTIQVAKAHNSTNKAVLLFAFRTSAPLPLGLAAQPGGTGVVHFVER